MLTPDIWSRLKLLVLDVDGVVTDGTVCPGDDRRFFNIRDGFAIKRWHAAGHASAILSGRTSASVEARAGELGIERVVQGIDDKLAALTEIISLFKLDWVAVAYVGDDIPDVPAMMRCGLAVAPADAAEATRRIAGYVTLARGGRGVVAEVVELILRKKRLYV